MRNLIKLYIMGIIQYLRNLQAFCSGGFSVFPSLFLQPTINKGRFGLSCSPSKSPWPKAHDHLPTKKCPQDKSPQNIISTVSNMGIWPWAFGPGEMELVGKWPWANGFGWQMSVGKCLWANICGQMSVGKCLWASAHGQISMSKCPWANIRGQMSVGKYLRANIRGQMAVGQCL